MERGVGNRVVVTSGWLRKVAVRLRDTADESRRNVAEFTGADDAVEIPGLKCMKAYTRLVDRVAAATRMRGAKLATAADALEASAVAYANNEEANARLFPTG